MSDRKESPDRGGAPEPPERWKPDESYSRPPEGPTPQNENPDLRTGTIGGTRVELKGGAIHEFESARRLVVVSQVCAIVSFIIGGVMLSSVALVCAGIAFGKLNRIASVMDSAPDAQRALRRIGYMAIGLAVVTLIINIVALVVLYPTLMETMQAASTGTLASGNSTWG